MDVKEIQQFSTILSVAKRGGGNVSQIIRNTAELISDKVETTQEMMTCCREDAWNRE